MVSFKVLLYEEMHKEGKTFSVIDLVRGPIWGEKVLCTISRDGKIGGAASYVLTLSPTFTWIAFEMLRVTDNEYEQDSKTKNSSDGTNTPYRLFS